MNRNRLWNPKAEAVRLWEADPCGLPAGEISENTPEFFAAVDGERYGRYAPWLPDAIGFSQFAGQRVLEVGCGMGSDLAQFWRGGAVALGIDLVPRHLNIAKRRVVYEGSPVRLARSDAEQLPFKDSSVDAVYSFGVLHHTPHIEVAIDEIWRVLKPGGLAIIGLYHRNSVFYWFFTIFLRGILKGVLFRRGYRRLLADIESHRHSDALPLVQVYSRDELRCLLRRFPSVDIQTHHLAANHFSHVAPLFRFLPRSSLERYGCRWGWYVIARARK